MEIRYLQNREQANIILEFFYSGKVLTWDLTKNEKTSIKERINNSLGNKISSKFYFISNKPGEIIAAGSIEKDEKSRGGFVIAWLGVREDYRRMGLGKKIMKEIERYVKTNKGKFITIVTSQVNTLATSFYKSLGYKIVGEIPDYYGKNYNKITFYKSLSS